MQAGLVATVRGRNGGVRLAKPASEITLFDVVRVTEDNFTMAECFEEGSDCPLVNECSLNEALRKALGAFFEVLASYSIEDLIQSQPNTRHLLGIEFPEVMAAVN